MRKSCWIVLLVMWAAAAGAQESQQASKEYYLRQYIKVQKAYIDAPDDVSVNLRMADFYSRTDNPMRNLPLAMDHVARAENLFVEIISDPARSGEGRRLMKKRISIKSIREQKQQILVEARNDVVAGWLSDAQEDAYIAAFGNDATIGRQIKKQRLQQAYVTACNVNTVESYYTFIRNYSSTDEAECAEMAISKLAPLLFGALTSTADVDSVLAQFADSPSIQRQAEKSKSRIAFAAARQKHTIQGYKDFIAEHSSGDEYLHALELMDQLRMQQFLRLTTPQEYADFITANADDSLAERAMAMLRSMVGDKHDAIAAKIYLKQFSLDPHHSVLFQRYYEWISAEGNSKPIETFAAEYPNYPYPAAVSSDLRQAASIDAFELNVPFTNGDYVPYASFMRMNSEKRIALVALQRSLQQFCAQRNWKGALARMEELELVFDNDNKASFEALKKIISTPGKACTRQQYETFPSFNLTHPVPHPDGRHLYFTQLTDEGTVICVAPLAGRKGKGSRWGLAEQVRFANVKNLGLTIYGFYDGGNKMVLGKNGDIWFAQREDSLWRVTEMPSFPLNTDYHETDAYMLPDGSGLLMASDRPNGYNFQPSGSNFHGDTALANDLYFVPLTDQGWGTPVNLGSQINTCYAERSPVLSRNLKTLYFVSDGHIGLGYGDIFMATRKDMSGWTEWSDPIHLGREANTGFDEASVAFSCDEDRLFVSSNSLNGHYGCYSIGTLHDTVLNHRTLVLDVSSFEESLMQVDICDAESCKPMQTIRYPSGKTIFLPLMRDCKYVLMATADGRFAPAVSIQGDTMTVLSMRAYTWQQLLALEQPLPLSLVTFEKQTSQMSSRSVAQLDQLVLFLKEHPQGRVTIVVDVAGYEDESGYNLAYECGKSVRRYLMGQGISQDRVGVASYSTCRHKKENVKNVYISLRFSDMN